MARKKTQSERDKVFVALATQGIKTKGLTDNGHLATPERIAQGPFDVVTEVDENGITVTHMRSVDTLARMFKAGTITDGMYSAGRMFQNAFFRASISTTSSSRFTREASSTNRGSMIEAVEDAKQKVHDALERMGGASTPCGSAVWFVLGMGDTIEEWARRQCWGNGRHLNPQSASGVLVGGLGSLEAFYGTIAKGRAPKPHPNAYPSRHA